MGREYKLNELDSLLSELEYPVAREDAVAACDDVTLLLADGRENLGGTLARSNDDAFDSAEELKSEVLNLLPRRAVGEPYQSEGEG
ncbi:DUF5789 family protein [Haloarchaeobius sp. HRN-SO-5]|uniref:DUF5789 family protein n=1 Tax=Haloarchaeobius sp. HRN-SO-5 TaxID=3446118 RepID=UPI003EBBDF03